MTFTSNIFMIGLLPWFLIIFYLLRNKVNLRKLLVLLANVIFYVWGGAVAFMVICCMSLITWGFCKMFEIKKNKVVLGMGCIIILLPLLAVKYIGFFAGNMNNVFGLSVEVPNFIVPMGISFFTFEAISCMNDVYSGKVSQKITLLDVFLYLTFFPTVVAGPIIRINDFKSGYLKELNVSCVNDGIERIIIGLCKKVLIADKISVLADYYFDGVASGNSYSFIGLWIGSISYTLQLYFDFSGYSDMALGIGKIIGFEMPENFNKPYQARSIQDFWRRWHISLSRWFRDYIYIPLGGNRCSIGAHVRNMLIVWILTGIWHGADWGFVVWGLGYFLLLMIEKYVPKFKKIENYWYGNLYALFFINLLWIPFRATNLQVAIRYIYGMFSFSTNSLFIEEKAIHFLPILVLSIVLCSPVDKIIEKYKENTAIKISRSIVLTVLMGAAVCAMINASYLPYIYGKF